MKLLFSTLLVATMAASLQAVTVAWTLANSRWISENNNGTVANWTGTNPNDPTLNVYVFFSVENYSAKDAAAQVATGYVSDNTGTVKLANYDYGVYEDKAPSTLSVYQSNLNTATPTASGYYYMVIFENNTTSDTNYAVAKTTQITGTANGVDDNDQGVYNTDAGSVPDVAEYVELNWMAGSTWGAPLQTPEPTAMALLALGVAGLALRRKNA